MDAIIQQHKLALGTLLIAIDDDWSKSKAAMAVRELVSNDDMTAAAVFAENLDLRNTVKLLNDKVKVLNKRVKELEKLVSLHEGTD
jgi:hypothetical protein